VFSRIWLALHPFIFAGLPVVLVLSMVKQEILPEETLSTLCVLELVAAIVLALCLLIFRNLAKAAIAATIVVIFCCTYRFYSTFCTALFPQLETMHGLLLLGFSFWLIFFINIGLSQPWQKLNSKFAIDYESFSGILTTVSLFLMVLNVVPLAIFEIEQENVLARVKSIYQKDLVGTKLEPTAQGKPDIYYIILDGFAGPKSIEQFYGYKDPGFLDFLKTEGFYVVPHAVSNYDRTEFSVCSSLNMNYLDEVVKLFPDKRDATSLIFMRLIQQSSLLNLLRTQGYKFETVSSGSFGTDHIMTADKVIKASEFNHFSRALGFLTPWWSLEHYFPLLCNAYCDTRLLCGTRMQEITSFESPKFVFIHTDLPHEPYTFDENGNRLELRPSNFGGWNNPTSGYFRQYTYCVREVEAWIKEIKRITKGKAVIIVQSDHGPAMSLRLKQGKVSFDPKDPQAINNPQYLHRWYNERMRILNAYYLPEQEANYSKIFYPDITPVNSFRVILNQYFKANLPLLKDHCYCPPLWETPFDWQDVRKEIEFPDELEEARTK
jgi:hypothetical protein